MPSSADLEGSREALGADLTESLKDDSFILNK